LNRRLAAALSAGFSLLISFFVFTKSFFDEHHPNFYDQHIESPLGVQYIIMHFITGFFTFYFSYRFCFRVFRKKWATNRRRRLAGFFGTLGVSVLTCAVLSAAALPFLQEIPGGLHAQFVHVGIKRGVASMVIVFVSTAAISTFIRNQRTEVENQRLVAENIRNRYEALKNQLDPHFLFNSLNTLDGLIGYDDDKARQYLQNLSSTFRYAIQNKTVATLKEELKFAECYEYLMKIRYGDSLNIQYAVDEKYSLYCILPLSLQTLIENAVKHNVVNDRHPLTIRLETTENDTIKISNAIRPKIDSAAGEGVGLSNLVERYRLLFGMEVAISKTDFFTVEIPLVKKYESRHS